MQERANTPAPQTCWGWIAWWERQAKEADKEIKEFLDTKRKTRFIIGDKKHTEFWTKYLEKEDSNPKVKRIKFENVSEPETAQL